MSTEDLSDELLSKILNYLPLKEAFFSRSVSRRFKYLISYERWRIDLSEFYDDGYYQRKKAMWKIARDLLARLIIWIFSLFGIKKVQKSAFTTSKIVLGRIGRNVDHLIIPAQMETKEIIMLLDQFCYTIGRLTVQKKVGKDKDFWVFLSRISKKMPNLRTIDVAEFDLSYLTCFPQLKHINGNLICPQASMSQLSAITWRLMRKMASISTIDWKNANRITEFLQSCPSVKKLEVVGPAKQCSVNQIVRTPIKLMSVCETFNRLVKVHMENLSINSLDGLQFLSSTIATFICINSKCLTSTGNSEILAKLTKLKSLRLDSNYRLVADYNFLSKLRHLSRLEVRKCKKFDVWILKCKIKANKCLRSICVDFCPAVGDELINFLCDRGIPIIRLSAATDSKNSNGISTAAIEKFMYQFEDSIEELNLAGNSQISNMIYQQILICGRYLKMVNLTGINTTEAGLGEFLALRKDAVALSDSATYPVLTMKLEDMKDRIVDKLFVMLDGAKVVLDNDPRTLF